MQHVVVRDRGGHHLEGLQGLVAQAVVEDFVLRLVGLRFRLAFVEKTDSLTDKIKHTQR